MDKVYMAILLILLAPIGVALVGGVLYFLVGLVVGYTALLGLVH
jgi:hypothetical protein